MRRIALFGILLAVVGCGSKPTLVGKWNIPVDKVPDLVADLSSEGKAAVNGTYQGIKISASGTWQSTEDSMTVKLEKLSVPKELEAFSALYKDQEKKLLVPVTMSYEWLNPDEVMVTPPSGASELFNKPFTMRRQKEQK